MHTVTAPKTKLSPFEFRQALQGNMDLSMLPLKLAAQIRTAQRRIQRQQMRAFKRETKARDYAVAGLNGKRAVARRARQIAAGQLQVSV